ncbi:conserved hypothetical protein [Anaeromyxobacter sp. K]|uniref:hypothetical protein n=1 Tax=Anaeromyxobacter sp. (strain K) TaxID=447217 RepID=UPI00015F8CCA|nr:hypothetical protein [Anaeromyxobacter sp. K]ACG72220.1 conserved hypothetical protein [Anaeromyxobacter sp. K]
MRRLALLALALSAACAGARRAPPAAEQVAFAPGEPVPGPAERDLAGKNEEELAALGAAATQAGDVERAAAAWARLADAFPASPRAPEARLRAGLAYQRAGAWRLALERFRARAAGPGDAAGALEAEFGAAECRYHLGELDEAAAALAGLAGRPGLEPAARIRALALHGVVERDAGRAAEAERSLRLAVARFEEASAAERLEPYFAAQAQYYLGELYRDRVAAVRLDPSTGDADALHGALERKSEALLSAQGEYLRAIRLGDARWAVAAGARVGELYDGLRRELLEAPLPPGLDAARADAYRAELRGQVAVLASKAASAYEQTLDWARRAGVDDPALLDGAREALSRLEQAAAGEAPAVPSR